MSQCALARSELWWRIFDQLVREEKPQRLGENWQRLVRHEGEDVMRRRGGGELVEWGWNGEVGLQCWL